MNIDEKKMYNTIYEIYLKNLEFFEKEYPEIFKKIVIVDLEIENGSYTSNYELEFNQEGGYFNIINLKTNNYLYESNSYDMSDEIANNTDYTNQNASSLLSINYNNYTLCGESGTLHNRY